MKNLIFPKVAGLLPMKQWLALLLKIVFAIEIGFYSSYCMSLMLVLTIKFKCVIIIKVDFACRMSARFNCTINSIKLIYSGQTVFTTYYSEQFITIPFTMVILKYVFCLATVSISIYAAVGFYFGLYSRKFVNGHTFFQVDLCPKTSIIAWYVTNSSILSSVHNCYFKHCMRSFTLMGISILSVFLMEHLFLRVFSNNAREHYSFWVFLWSSPT